MHNTSTALAGIATYMCSGKAKMIAQELNKQRSIFHVAGHRPAIDVH
jgi:hypothetical protein